MAITEVRTFEVPQRPAPGPWTTADLERFPDDGYQYEVWHGELVRMAPAGGRHGECETNLVAALHTQVGVIGRAYTGDTGFVLRESPTDLVAPDVAFVRHDRLPPAEERTRFLRVVPDVAIEIRSPGDSDADLRTKLNLYIATGVHVVWLMDPSTQTVEEVRRDPTEAQRCVRSRVLRAEVGDILQAEDVLPEFKLPLADLFA